MDEVNKRTSGNNGVEFDGRILVGNTKNLMNVENSLLSWLKGCKWLISTQTLLPCYWMRSRRDHLILRPKKENDMMVRGAIEQNELLSVLKGKGMKPDKLCFANFWAVNYVYSETQLYLLHINELESLDKSLRA